MTGGFYGRELQNIESHNFHSNIFVMFQIFTKNITRGILWNIFPQIILLKKDFPGRK